MTENEMEMIILRYHKREVAKCHAMNMLPNVSDTMKLTQYVLPMFNASLFTSKLTVHLV